MKRINRTEFLQCLLLGATFGLMICFFSPYEIVRTNQSEFLIASGQIVKALLLTSVVAVILMSMVLFVLCSINKVVFRLVRALIAGFILCGYIQMLFYNGKMQPFNNINPSTAVKEFSLYSITNFAIMVVIFFAPVIVTATLIDKEKKDGRARTTPSKVLTYLVAAILAMQTAGALQNKFGIKTIKNDDEYPKILSYLSYDGATTLSKDNNVIVFIVDRLDGDWLNTTLECYPELYEELEGFTFFRDNISCYSLTFPSVPQLVTGKEFTGTTWSDYLEYAWSGTNYLSLLREGEYSTNLILDENTTYLNLKDVAQYADNVYKPTQEEIQNSDEFYRINYINSGGVVPVFLRLSMARLVPYICKDAFTADLHGDPSERFVEILKESKDRHLPAVGNQSDTEFFSYLQEVGIKDTSDKKAFVFVHLNGVHNPDEVTAGRAPDGGKAAPNETIATARGAFVILSEYLNQMKQMNVFDNSTIIIVGDHGRQPFEILDEKKIDSRIVTGLLVKPRNAERNRLIVDTETQLSNKYIPATILEAAGLDYSAYGVSIQDVIKDHLSLERTIRFYYFYGYFNPYDAVCTYRINGDGCDFNNWDYTLDMKK